MPTISTGYHRLLHRIGLFLLIHHCSYSVFTQCPSNQLLPNPSFEEMSCCPDGSDDSQCIVEWDEAVDFTSPDYYHVCGYMGNPGIYEPPPGFPNGQGCMGLSYMPQDQTDMLMTCLSVPLHIDSTYRFSAYCGFNKVMPFDPSQSPVIVTFWGDSSDCSYPAWTSMAGFPPDPWDALGSVTYTFDGDKGWVFGATPCFQPTRGYNQFIIAIDSTSVATAYAQYYFDVVELHTCVDLLAVDIIVGESCGVGANGSVDLTVSDGTPPYTFDWDIDGTGDFDDDEDQEGLAPGNYVVVVMDAVGLERCLNIYVPGTDVIPTAFDPVLPLCQHDPEIILPTTSTNTVPVTGTWTPSDTIFTDEPGWYTVYVSSGYVLLCRLIYSDRHHYQTIDNGRFSRIYRLHWRRLSDRSQWHDL